MSCEANTSGSWKPVRKNRVMHNERERSRGLLHQARYSSRSMQRSHWNNQHIAVEGKTLPGTTNITSSLFVLRNTDRQTVDGVSVRNSAHEIRTEKNSSDRCFNPITVAKERRKEHGNLGKEQGVKVEEDVTCEDVSDPCGNRSN